MATIPTLADISAKINQWIFENTTHQITATQLNGIFTDLVAHFSGANPVIGPIAVIVANNIHVQSVHHGSVINGITLSTGNIFSAARQADPTENGIYIVGNAQDGSGSSSGSLGEYGLTRRHPDYPDAVSCANRIIVSENPDESGNFTTMFSIDENGRTYVVINSTQSLKRITGAYSQDFKAKTWLQSMSILKISGIEPTIKIGTTEGGDDILTTTVITDTKLKTINKYFPEYGYIYYTITGGNASMIVRFDAINDYFNIS